MPLPSAQYVQVRQVVFTDICEVKTMATKRVCDRCGAEINPADGSVYAGMSNFRYEGRMTYELCGKCAYHLGRWLDGKDIILGEKGGDG